METTILGRKFKFKKIREDLAIHDFYAGYFSYAIMAFTTVTLGIGWGIISGFGLMVLYALFEIYQKLSGNGHMSINDWWASSRTAFMMLTILIITYTKYL